MQLIYVALKRQVVPPVKLLVEHWLSFPNLVGDISCTSLITRIAGASLEMPLPSTLILLVRSSATITSAKEDGSRYFKKNCTISTIRTQSRYLTQDWVYILCNLFWSMSRHNRSSSNLHERQLEPHRQTTPKLTHCPKMLCINHMKTSCQHTLVTHTKEEIYHRKDRPISEDRNLEVAGFTHHLRILYLPITLFQDSTISILRRSAKVSMTTWGRKWALRISTPTCYTNNNSGWTRQDNN
jgi:hypothetical protein